MQRQNAEEFPMVYLSSHCFQSVVRIAFLQASGCPQVFLSTTITGDLRELKNGEQPSKREM